jgi:hypothetical protein
MLVVSSGEPPIEQACLQAPTGRNLAVAPGPTCKWGCPSAVSRRDSQKLELLQGSFHQSLGTSASEVYLSLYLIAAMEPMMTRPGLQSNVLAQAGTEVAYQELGLAQAVNQPPSGVSGRVLLI